jgi:hypothetical protein
VGGRALELEWRSPGDEVVFSLYEGPSAEAIREANERSRFHFDRITEAVDLAGEAWP